MIKLKYEIWLEYQSTDIFKDLKKELENVQNLSDKDAKIFNYERGCLFLCLLDKKPLSNEYKFKTKTDKGVVKFTYQDTLTYKGAVDRNFEDALSEALCKADKTLSVKFRITEIADVIIFGEKLATSKKVTKNF